MAHARETIRDAVAGLVTGLTTTSTRVYTSRVWPVQAAELPCLLIYLGDEEIEAATVAAPRLLLRTLEVLVEGRAKAAANLDETLDDIAAEVEAALGASPRLGVGVHDCVLTAIGIELSEASTQPIGAVSLRYRVTYSTAETLPATII